MKKGASQLSFLITTGLMLCPALARGEAYCYLDVQPTSAIGTRYVSTSFASLSNYVKDARPTGVAFQKHVREQFPGKQDDYLSVSCPDSSNGTWVTREDITKGIASVIVTWRP